MKLLAVLIVLISVMSVVSSATIDSNRERSAKPKVAEILENDNEQKERRLTNKIIGGSDATYGNFPWQARVVYPDGSLVCGATIIDEYWLLSAAHCFYDGEKYEVIVGDHDIRIPDIGEQRFAVDSFKHEMYNVISDQDSDIALLRIVPINGRGIQFTKYVEPACLPTRNIPFTVGTKYLISGWGKYKNGGREPFLPILQSAVVELIDQKQCAEMYVKENATVTKNMFCAGYICGGIDACEADSGGPLVIKTEECPILLGIVSAGGEKCAAPNLPGVYVRVNEFLLWIYSTISTFSFDSDWKTLQASPK